MCSGLDVLRRFSWSVFWFISQFVLPSGLTADRLARAYDRQPRGGLNSILSEDYTLGIKNPKRDWAEPLLFFKVSQELSYLKRDSPVKSFLGKRWDASPNSVVVTPLTAPDITSCPRIPSDRVEVR